MEYNLEKEKEMKKTKKKSGKLKGWRTIKKKRRGRGNEKKIKENRKQVKRGTERRGRKGRCGI